MLCILFGKNVLQPNVVAPDRPIFSCPRLLTRSKAKKATNSIQNWEHFFHLLLPELDELFGQEHLVVGIRVHLRIKKNFFLAILALTL